MNSKSQNTVAHPLQDKVALLLNGTGVGGCSLAVSLAKNGADIAVVYRQSESGRAQETKKLVEAEGRSCLIIPAETDAISFSKEVLRQTIDELGQLDIFIDYSDYSSNKPGEKS